jgi:hypothetical protein
LAAQDEIPGLGPSSERPRLNNAADLTKQKLSPTEGFVLSRVDGRSSYDDICKITGLGRDSTLDILRTLKQAKLILGPNERAVGGTPKPLRPATPKSGVTITSESAPTSTTPATAAGPSPVEAGAAEEVPADQGPAPKTESARPKRPTSSSGGIPGPLQRLDDGTPVSETDLKDWPDADQLFKERVIRLHRRMRRLSPYELLGVPSNADAGAVKRAFAQASKELHPDRYFGKNLGSFRPKLAAIFARLSEAAHEIETEQKKQKR